MTFNSLPPEIHYKILSYVKPSFIIKEVSHINKQFNECYKSLFLWIEVLKQIPHYEFKDLINLLDYKPSLIPKIGYTIYYLYKQKNLIANPNMDEGIGNVSGQWIPPNIQGWICQPALWNVERHVGCDPFPEEVGDVSFNAVTSYTEAKRSQKCNLRKLCPWVQDLLNENYALALHAKVWTAPRYDCPSWFKSEVIIDGEGHTFLEVDHPAGKKWVKGEIEKVIKTLAEIEYTDRGSDSKYWAGCYGSKILSPTITLRLIKE